MLLTDVSPIRERFDGYRKVEIENLFGEEDRIRHYIIKDDKNKIQEHSSFFKSKIKSHIEGRCQIQLNIKTKESFFALLEYLHNKAHCGEQSNIVEG